MPCVYLPGPAPAVTVANNSESNGAVKRLHRCRVAGRDCPRQPPQGLHGSGCHTWLSALPLPAEARARRGALLRAAYTPGWRSNQLGVPYQPFTVPVNKLYVTANKLVLSYLSSYLIFTNISWHKKQYCGSSSTSAWIHIQIRINCVKISAKILITNTIINIMC
jgi:hypothetical protein